MIQRSLLATCLLLSTTAAWAAGTGTGQTAQEGRIDPRADQALRQMSDYLAGLQSFRVAATTIDEKVTKEGQKIQVLKESKVAVQRPGRMRVDRVGPQGHAVFIDDGKQFLLHHQERNVYATAPAPAQLDAALDQAREKLHIDAPGADLLMSRPYAALIEGVQTGRYIGKEPVGGVMAHHLAMTEKGVDWQLWIQDGPKPVPLRYVITTKDLPGRPQFTVELHDWQPSVELADSTFAVTPPEGARRIEFTAPRRKP